MDEQSRALLLQLTTARRVAALGTLHNSEPLVSMVPVALFRSEGLYVVLVSGLSAHTQDMRANPRTSLMLAENETHSKPPHSLARVSLQCQAVELAEFEPMHLSAKSEYLNTFPGTEGLFELGDFALFTLRPDRIRFVGGFARAFNVSRDQLMELWST